MYVYTHTHTWTHIWDRFVVQSIQGVYKYTHIYIHTWAQIRDRFLVQSIRRMERDGEWRPIQDGFIASENVMDNWIQAASAGLVQFVRKEMEAYRLYTVRFDIEMCTLLYVCCMHGLDSVCLQGEMGAYRLYTGHVADQTRTWLYVHMAVHVLYS